MARFNREEYDLALNRARKLLKEILPDEVWEEFQETGRIRVEGVHGTYYIRSSMATVVRSEFENYLACLQLKEETPYYDRMIAEYLLILNSEELYRKKANFIGRRSDIQERIRILKTITICWALVAILVTLAMIWFYKLTR